MLTLTYEGEGCHEPDQLKSDVAEFVRDLRTGLGGKPLPYVWVPEWHKTHGLHVHMGLGRYVRRSMIGAAWQRGIFDIRLLGDLSVTSGDVGKARRTAGYLSKYVSKAMDDDRRILGRHRYEVAEGFQPASVRIHGRTARIALEHANEHMGSRPIIEWNSDDVEGWRGPPAIWAQWQ